MVLSDSGRRTVRSACLLCSPVHHVIDRSSGPVLLLRIADDRSSVGEDTNGPAIAFCCDVAMVLNPIVVRQEAPCLFDRHVQRDRWGTIEAIGERPDAGVDGEMPDPREGFGDNDLNASKRRDRVWLRSV